MIDSIRKACKSNIDIFTKKVIPTEWYPRSILLSESFALCAIANFMKIDLFIESGIYNGRSTLIWSKFFDSNIEIKAIDLKIRQEAKDNLKSYIKNGRIDIIEGNSNDIIPKLISENTDKYVGLFIDGPKSTIAIDLIKKCLFQNKNIKFAAVHDCYNGTVCRNTMDLWDINKFYTDDKEFVEKYQFLDKEESQHDVEQNITWTPYKILPDRDLRGSYGPTMCIIFNQHI